MTVVGPYTVVWTSDVQNDFIDQWIISDSQNRQRLTDVATVIDRELAIAPQNRGASIPSEPALRVWKLPDINPSASAVFEILPKDRIVRVLRISLATE